MLYVSSYTYTCDGWFRSLFSFKKRIYQKYWLITMHYIFHQEKWTFLLVIYTSIFDIYVKFDPLTLISVYRPQILSRSNSIITTKSFQHLYFCIRHELCTHRENVENWYLRKMFSSIQPESGKKKNCKDIILRCVVMADRFQYVWIQISYIPKAEEKKILFQIHDIFASSFVFFGWIF